MWRTNRTKKKKRKKRTPLGLLHAIRKPKHHCRTFKHSFESIGFSISISNSNWIHIQKNHSETTLWRTSTNRNGEVFFIVKWQFQWWITIGDAIIPKMGICDETVSNVIFAVKLDANSQESDTAPVRHNSDKDVFLIGKL